MGTWVPSSSAVQLRPLARPGVLFALNGAPHLASHEPLPRHTPDKSLQIWTSRSFFLVSSKEAGVGGGCLCPSPWRILA